jgi:hypothetical protein
MGVQRVERVSTDLARFHLAQDGPDDPGDVTPVSCQSGFGEVSDLKVLVENPAR